MLENLNWYPGHMKKTRELISQNLKMVDCVIEVVDSRIPISSRNPIIEDIIGSKDKIIILNKVDLSEEIQTSLWKEYFQKRGYNVVKLNSNTGDGLKVLNNLLESMENKKNLERSIKKPFRFMIVGVPNVGKSSLINRLMGRKSAQVGDRPGVTRGKQWLTMKNGMQLLDTPGILWPKFEDPKVGVNLAFCGSIKDEILPIEDLAYHLIDFLVQNYSELLKERYSLDEIYQNPLDTMDVIALKRGFILSGKRIDYERTARTIIDEFRNSKIGRITLERCIKEH